MSPDETLCFYDDNAADYAAGTSGPVQRHCFRTFADKLDPKAKILDLGSGGGHDALWLIEHGFDVTLLDGSAGLAKEAEADWHDRLGRYFCAMSAVHLRTLADADGLFVGGIERSKGRGYDDEDAIWLSLTARRKP